MRGFRDFILQGNVVELAVAVVVAVAFGAVVTALVEDLLTPLIAAIGGQPDFSSLDFTINESRFLYGDFINAVIAFLLIAAVVYFLVVLPYTKLRERRRSDEPVGPIQRACPRCLSNIPVEATRCAFCTSDVGAAA